MIFIVMLLCLLYLLVMSLREIGSELERQNRLLEKFMARHFGNED